VDLFFGADDQVADKAGPPAASAVTSWFSTKRFSPVLAGQAPQHRAIVDVEGHAAAGALTALAAFRLAS
jgi:hypothetical protein